jgi:hypothetical protein
VATLEQTAYEIAVRTLAQQENAVNELRARTGTLLTASSLTASFFGTEAINRYGLGVLTVAGLLAFATSVVLATVILWPKPGLVFSLGGEVAYEALRAVGEDERRCYRLLTRWLQQVHDRNEPAKARLIMALTVASGALVAEILFFGAAFGVS